MKIHRALHFLSTTWFLAMAGYLRAAATTWRDPSIEELKTLFNVATQKPDRSHFLADIEYISPPWTEAQVEAELERQNAIFRRLGAPQPTQGLLEFSRQQIKRAHMGSRLRHVEEWYSKCYRLDETDEAMVSERYLQKNTGEFHNTFVNIDDRALSKYATYAVDRESRIISVARPPGYRVGPDDLWEAMSMPFALARVVLVACGRLDYERMNMVMTYPYIGLSRLPFDRDKVARLLSDTHSGWRIRCAITKVDGLDVMQFELSGQLPRPNTRSETDSVEVHYWIATLDRRGTLVKGELTNRTTGAKIECSSSDFDAEGLPRRWEKTVTDRHGKTITTKVHFKMIDLNPAIADREIFLPRFYAGYRVVDITSGHPIPIADDFASTDYLAFVRGRRVLIIGVLCGLVLIPVILAVRATLKSRKPAS
jgi:hypothetical protein